jgi:phage tail sheath gpL-like
MPEAPIPLNPNLPPGYEMPGVFTSWAVSDPGATTPNNRALLFGYVQAGYPATPNQAFQAVTQSQVNGQVGPKSHLGKVFAAGKAQLGAAGVGADIWLVPLQEPAAGVQATHLLKFMAQPVADNNGKLILGSNVGALTTHVCEIYLGARRIAAFVVKKDDTFATIATNAQAELDKLTDLEITPARAGDTITFTDQHKGEHGNDCPLRVDFSDPAGGVAASPGTATFAAGPAGANGSATLKTHVRDCVASIANADTDAASAGKLRDAINSDSYPVYAAIANPATGVVTLFYRTGRWAHKLSTSVSGIAPQTLTAAVGTLGVGVPTLTSALSTLAGDTTAYRAWGCFWTDAATWGTLSTHIEGQSVSPIEKGQTAHGCLTTGGVANVTPFPGSTTPKLEVSPRYAISWYQGSPMRNWEVAARTAVMVAAGQRPSLNYNGMPLVGTDSTPVAAAPKADRPTLDELNTALVAGLAPIAVGTDGLPHVVSSRTTYKAVGFTDAKLKKWSCILTIDYYRLDLRIYLSSLYLPQTSTQDAKRIKTKSPVRTSLALSPDSVKAAIFRRVKLWDDMDIYDGSDSARDAIFAGILVSPTRIDVALPMRPPADLDQLSVHGEVQ